MPRITAIALVTNRRVPVFEINGFQSRPSAPTVFICEIAPWDSWRVMSYKEKVSHLQRNPSFWYVHMVSVAPITTNPRNSCNSGWKVFNYSSWWWSKMFLRGSFVDQHQRQGSIFCVPHARRSHLRRTCIHWGTGRGICSANLRVCVYCVFVQRRWWTQRGQIGGGSLVKKCNKSFFDCTNIGVCLGYLRMKEFELDRDAEICNSVCGFEMSGWLCWFLF